MRVAGCLRSLTAHARAALPQPQPAAPRLLSGAAGAASVAGAATRGFGRCALVVGPPPAAPWRAGASARGLAAAAVAAQPPSAPLRVYVKRLEDAAFTSVEVGADSDIASLTKAALSELHVDASPSAVTLTREGASAPLDSTLPISESVATGALAPLAKLILVVHAPAPPANKTGPTARYQRLRDALRTARAEPLEGGGAQSGAALVRLPADCGAEWPQLGPGAPLFVRSFYSGCFEGVLASFDVERAPDAPRKFTIIGNAGIGKSAFGAYLLWRAVQARRTVIYVSEKVKDAFILHGDGRVEAFSKAHFDDRCSAILDDMSAVLICDGVKPPVCSAFTVLITSPVRERWKEFDKCVDASRLFFPVFSLREIGDMRRACFPRLSGTEAEAGVQERYEKWGGIPRYVLAKLGKDSQELLARATRRIDVDALLRDLDEGEIESDAAVSHRLVHLKPAGERADGSFSDPHSADSYLFARSELGSTHIVEAVLRAAEQRDLDRLHSMLAEGLASATFATLYGSLFERAALRVLAAGGQFELHDLTNNAAAGNLVLAPSAVVTFSSVTHLAEEVRSRAVLGTLDAAVFVPNSKTFTAVDAVLGRGRLLLNFTISTDHKLLMSNTAGSEGAAPIAKALGVAPSEDIKFLWVLPTERFDMVRREGKPFKVVAATPGSSSGAAHGRVVQFALRVPFERRAPPVGPGRTPSAAG